MAGERGKDASSPRGAAPAGEAANAGASWRLQSRVAWLLAGIAALAAGAGTGVGLAWGAGTLGALPALAAGASGLAALTIVAVWAVRLLLAPLEAMAAFAERAGRDMGARMTARRASQEVQALAEAFNRMHESLDAVVAERTAMLGAISHDLRTPCTRLRLRAEFVEDSELRAQILGDLDAMEAMIDDALALLRDDVLRESPERVQVEPLVASLCNDFQDMGRPVSWQASQDAGDRLRTVGSLLAAGGQSVAQPAFSTSLTLVCRPRSLRRSLTNLIENALKYGGAARVWLDIDDTAAAIRVGDDGPGIAPERKAEAVQPFRRLDGSAGTRGSGLGLAIAQSVAKAHGGRLDLANAHEHGGLVASLVLPREETPLS